MYGWMETILIVNLTDEKIIKEPLDESVARDFIGGRGLNSLTLFKEVKPDIDPLGPENVICFASGPLTGTPLSLTSRIEVSTLSPLTGILGDGNGGGDFPTFLRLAGYEQIVISGKASGPKYLWINDGNVELRDASHLWGKTTWEATDILKQTHGTDVRVACIGQAGENLVRMACTVFDKYATAARGSGAVLGSKNLKAIAVRGTGKVQLAMSKEFQELAREDTQFILNDPRLHDVVGVYGTHLGMSLWFPSRRYFQKRMPPEEVPVNLRMEAWKEYEIKRHACFGCVLHCKNEFRIPTGKYAGEVGAGLEFETIDCLGTDCGMVDAVAIMELGNLSDKYGMCTIPLGNVIAFAKDLYHRGIITKEDTGGLSLDWEDAEAQIELVHQTALRTGFGNLIAEGMYSLAKIIGRGAMDDCHHVKGLCRGPLSLTDDHARVYALAGATSTRGADHLRGRTWACEDEAQFYPKLLESGILPANIPHRVIIAERATTLTDTIGRCKGAVNNWECALPLVWKYPLYGGVSRLLKAATGFEFSESKLEEIADRIYLIEMAFNARQGITRKHDRLPQTPEIQGTPQGKRELEEHDKMLTEYYQLRGCDVKTGIPKRETLEHLGLKFVADELEAHGPYPEWDGPPIWPLDKYSFGGKRA